MRSTSEKFVDLASPRRLWVVAAINGNLERLATLHDHLALRFSIRDRLVYTGNYIGTGAFDNHAVLEELLAFRSALLSKPGMEIHDIVHLRGPTEEAWQRLLRLQFAPSASMAVERCLQAGAEAYLRLYGVSVNDTKSIARAGSVAITRWTNQLRGLQRQVPGHEPFVCSLRRAAITFGQPDGRGRVLVVPAGYDFRRTLDEQGDNLWFPRTSFHVDVEETRYARVIRGADPMQAGVSTDRLAVTLDGGCGRGGPLMCGCFDGVGNLLELVTVGGRGAVESSRFESVARSALPESRAANVQDILAPAEQWV